MNTEQASGKFEQLKGSIKKAWGKLTDNDIMLYNGNREQFLGRLKEVYGLDKEAAERSIADLEKACTTACATDKQATVEKPANAA